MAFTQCTHKPGTGKASICVVKIVDTLTEVLALRRES